MIAIENIFIKLVFTITSVFLMGSIVAAQEKESPKLRLSYTKHMSGAYEIKAHAYIKKGRQTDPCSGANICFYTDAAYSKLFKKMKTDDMGLAVLLIDEGRANQFKDSTGKFNFYANLKEDSKFNTAEAEVSAIDAVITVNFKQETDTTRMLKASIMCYDPAAKKMIAGVKVPLKCFVRRALCLLPVGKDLNFTGEEGNIEVPFPNDIPGDKDGNIIVIVKLDEDDTYGTVQYEKSIPWGVPLLHSENPLAHRSLVSPGNNAPWFMVIVISAILIGIWGYLCYIIYGLFKINKAGQTNAQ
jgi:hypothetical protein